MNIFEDWKFCLTAAVGVLALMVFTGDLFGLLFFPFYYWQALKHFDKEME